MTTVFLSGSRRIARIGEEVRGRIDNMVQSRLSVITGDANGADRAMQAYLHEIGYADVTVYYVGAAPRNNVGSWPTKNVPVDGKLSGREFYSQKDQAMARIADLGFVLWDGKSSGSVQNMLWLLLQNKTVVVFYAPEKQFYNLRTEGEFSDLLSKCDGAALSDIGRKIRLPERIADSLREQAHLNL